MRLGLGAAFVAPIVASFSMDGLTISKVHAATANGSGAVVEPSNSVPSNTTIPSNLDDTSVRSVVMQVSAALIVRDKSAFIEGCLKSLAGIVDEIVVVDTGSTDDTIEKARHFPIKLHRFRGARIFPRPATTRSTQASGEWILYIDADERLEVPDLAVWRDVVADKGKAGWKLRFYPRVGWTPYAELRLFRNDPRIRFRGCDSRAHARWRQ